MKILLQYIIALTFILSFSSNASAQLKLPKASPPAFVSQEVGLTQISVKYHAPGVKGRQIWGDVVPYGEIWRTGANEATTITFEDNVLLNGERVPAGTYALFTVPESDSSWYVVLNNDTTLWGTENYTELNDIVRLKVSPQQTEFHETLQYSFRNVEKNSADLCISWEKLRIPLHIETDVRSKAMKNMRMALAGAASDDWLVYAQCANFLVENNMEHELALQWIDQSLTIKETFYNNWVKAQLLAQKNEYELATELTKKAMKLGESDTSTYKTFASQIEQSYQIWKKKRY